jgi:acyl-CoA synthetase (AMP-forming)/AMP-acid ligase II
MNLAEFLYASADRHGRRPAVTDVRSHRSLTYEDLARESARIRSFLAGQGVERGQRIGLVAPNGLAYLPAAFGLLETGACLVPIATNLAPAEIADIVERVDVNGCLSWRGAELFEGAARLSEGVCEGFSFRWLDRNRPGPAGFCELNPAFIRFTSGTTAQSKGVVLSHEATAARVEASDRALHFTAEDSIAWVLPLAYHFAVTMVAYVRAGCHILMCSDTSPSALADAIERLRASIFYASPLHFERLSNLGRTRPLACLRLALSTSAPIASAVIARFEAAYGIPVGQAYGLIEAGLPCINLGREGLSPASVGRPVPGYEIAVLSEDLRPVAARAVGEIGVRGNGLFSAYYAPWTLREAIERDGWFMTGDIGSLDDVGALRLAGRKKAVIFVAGLKFFPEEVEDCINQFPGIVESRVFGRPHPRLGEVPCAEVVFAPGRRDIAGLKAHCAHLLSPYKVPLDFESVDAVPRTPGGKILRRPATEDASLAPEP